MARILIVEDEPDIALGLVDDLAREGYQVETAATGPEGLKRARGEAWELVLLDVMLPGMDGFDVCRELRRARIRTPVIMLTARAHDAEKVMGLELGADDYITKPFNPRELRARVKAMLRRFDDGSPGVYCFGSVEVDFDRAEVRRDGTPVDLTALEFRLLQVLIERRGRVLSRAQLIEAAWEPATHVSDRVVDTHILHLRQKIEREPSRPQYLHGVRGIGYRFDGRRLDALSTFAARSLDFTPLE
ncbi:MAG: response regulator transcription factor [Bryobacterales bacterium]|nr:response regulator transcription factor [Bryobacterales bacterium]